MNDGLNDFPTNIIPSNAWRVNKAGSVYQTGGLQMGGTLTGTFAGAIFTTNPIAGVYGDGNTIGGGQVQGWSSSIQNFSLNSAGINLKNSSYIKWSSTTSSQGVSDIVITREAAGILSQNSGMSPQKFRVYNSTGVNSGEFGQIDWTNNNLTIGSVALGVGLNRDVSIVGGNNLNLVSDSISTGIILSGGFLNLYGNTSGSAPVNTTTANGWIDIFVSGRNVKIPYYV